MIGIELETAFAALDSEDFHAMTILELKGAIIILDQMFIQQDNEGRPSAGHTMSQWQDAQEILDEKQDD